jgi:hypothetical protein
MTNANQSIPSPQVALKVQKEIRRTEDELVKMIQDALEQTQYGELEESQFRNLVSVSDTTDSAEVIKNFLLYQVGRDKKWGRGDKSLATRIVNDIKKIQSLAKNITVSAKAKDENSIYLDLIRRYLGYGARYLTYKRKGKA